MPQFRTVPSARLTSSQIQECGLISSTFVTVPWRLTGRFGTEITVIPASAASLVRICRFAITIVLGIFCVSATTCGTTTGAPGFRSFATAAA